MIHQYHVVCRLKGMGKIVNDHNNGLSLCSQHPRLLHQLQLMGNIQIGGRFIQKDHRRILDQRHSNINFLPLSAREILHQLICQLRNTHGFHSSIRNGIVLFSVAAGIAQIRKSAMENQTLHRNIRNLAALGKVCHPLS